ncbi:MAG: hypothetical protein ACYC9J_11640 [Sulfuricaulis sp.]
MANNYTEGTGALVFDGEPKLSAVSAILMDHVHQYEGKDGFYLEEGAYVSPEDLAESLIDYALGLIKDDASSKTLKRKLEKAKKECSQFKHKAFQKLPILLREAGVPVNDALAEAIRNETSHPIDYVQAVVDDKDSNLLAVSYEECYRCEKMRPGEFGGLGYFHSRNVYFVSGSYQTVTFSADLDKAIAARNMAAITALVSQRIAKAVDAIRDPDIRHQVAKKLLAGEALHAVEDGAVIQADGDDRELESIPENLGVKLFNEILSSVEAISAIAETHGQQTLVDLIYLLQLLANHKPGDKRFIEQTYGSRIVDFLRGLPNGTDYLEYVATNLSDESGKSAGGAA